MAQFTSEDDWTLKIKIGAELALVALMTSIALVGCNGSGTEANSGAGSSGSAGAPAAGSKALNVGVVFDSGGLGDKSFNDSANAGLLKAESDFGTQAKTVESKAEKDYEGNMTALADKGLDVIFAVGLTQGDALKKVAPKYPNIKFAIIDGDVDAPNVRSIQFQEEQGSFLAGYVAALVSKTGRIGFVGGMDIPLIHKFEDGYVAGAKTANRNVNVLPSKYTGSWDDVQVGKSAASVLFSGGADIVYHAAGRCGLGVIEAAKEAGKFAIGVDSDQDDVAPGHVLTSMIKHVDVGVYETIKAVKNGSFTAGTKVYNLKDGGVGLSDMKNTKDVVGAENLKKLADVRQQIIDGKIVVPADDASLKTYLAKIGAP